MVVFLLNSMKTKIWALFLVIAVLSGMTNAQPTGLLVTINNGAEYANSSTVSVAISASNTTGSTACNLSNEGSSWAFQALFSAFPVSWNLSGDGLKTVYCKCTDDGENYSNVSSDQIAVDTTAPSLSSFSPSNNSVSTNTAPEISVVLSDSGSGINSSAIALAVDGINFTASYSSGKLSFTPSSSLAEANHSAETWAYDNAGHLTYAKWNFTVDKVPSVSDISPANDAYVKSTSFTISASVSDSGSGINSNACMMKIDGTNANFTISSGRIEHTANLSEGTRKLEVWIYDYSGSYNYTNWSFIVDKTEPLISYLIPAENSTTGYVTTVSAKVSDYTSGIKASSLVMKLDGLDVSSSATYSSDVLSFTTSALKGGNHTVEIWAYDKAGNSAFKYWAFSVTSKAPIVDQQMPSSGSSTNSSKPNISARVTDAGTSGLDNSTLRLYLDGDDVTSKANFNGSRRTITYTPTIDLIEGEHTIRVVISDKIGNRADQSWKFSVDKTPPLPPSGLKINVTGTAAKLSWIASTGAVKYKLYRSSSKITSISGISALTTINATNYTDTFASGKLYYAVAAVDAAENVGTPAFAGTCAKYENGWVDYACCSNSDCTGRICNISTHTCSKITQNQTSTPPLENISNQSNITTSPTTNNSAANDSGTGGSKKKPLPFCGGGVILLALLASGIYKMVLGPES